MKRDERYKQLLCDIGHKDPTPAQKEALNGLAEHVGLETLEIDANVLRLLDTQRINKMLLLRDPEFYEEEGMIRYFRVQERAAQTGIPVPLYLAQTKRIVIFESIDELIWVVSDYGNNIGTLSFWVSITEATDEDLKSIPDLKGLKKLSLKIGENLTDEGFTTLARFTEVTHLELSGCRGITHEGLDFLKSLPDLEELSLSSTGISDRVYKRLGEIAPQKLKSLDLSSNQFLRGYGIGNLGKCPRLAEIDFRYCDVRDQALAEMKDIPQLSHLNIEECKQVTDEGVAQLKNIRRLTEVRLTGAYKVSDEAEEDLRNHFQGTIDISRVVLGPLGD